MNYFTLLLSVLLTAFASQAQGIANIQVIFNKEHEGLRIPVQLNLDALTLLPDSLIDFVEVVGKNKIPVFYQIEAGVQRNLHWLLEPVQPLEKRRLFELIRKKPWPAAPQMEMGFDSGALTIKNNNERLLSYNFKTVYPPKGVDTVFRRSGFIHPLWSPRGQELTWVNPPDHRHHLGLWNPWTEILFRKDTFDLWNLSRKQGTVRFAHFSSTELGTIYASYQALHEHIIFTKGGKQQVILNELQSIRVYQPSAAGNYYIADITIQLNCATPDPVVLLEYRYGGLGIRATKEWNKDNSEVITSEGKIRKDADGSVARWCLVQGRVNNDYAGLVLMSHPTNYNYPEPLRVWPETSNKRGDVFINFSPTKNMNWNLEPGKNYVLKYRLLVFNDPLTKEKAEEAWKNFAMPPKITYELEK